jgi:glycosyl transferase, family 25
MPRRRLVIKKDTIIDNESFLDKIDKIYFINLDDRKDRLESITEEIKKIDPELKKTKRIDAVKKDIGAIGCGLSHIKALKDAQENNYNNVIILEDDFVFLKKKLEINYSINYLFKFFEDFNICLLSGNIYRANKKKEIIWEAIEVQTTSGYIINSKFYQVLINNFQEAIDTMEKNYKYGQAEIDVQWKKLQGRDKKFYIFNPKLGKQLTGYSDIEKRHVKYNC